MGEGGVLPYLDIPFQHASPTRAEGYAPPRQAGEDAGAAGRLARGLRPDLVVRSTFVVGFPGETEADFEQLLAWLEEARLDRVGAFAYEDVKGAPANALPGHVPEDVKQARRDRLMALASRISRDKLRAHVGRTLPVLVDAVRPDGTAVARTRGDAPEVDGVVYVQGGSHLKAGDVRAGARDPHRRLRPAGRRRWTGRPRRPPPRPAACTG